MGGGRGDVRIKAYCISLFLSLAVTLSLTRLYFYLCFSLSVSPHLSPSLSVSLYREEGHVEKVLVHACRPRLPAKQG